MKPYPKYKESKFPWIGLIPDNWQNKKIKHTTYVKGRIGWKGLKSDEFKEKSYALLVTGVDFNGGLVDWDNCYQIDKERYDEDPYIQLHENDLLITKDGSIGKIALVRNLNGLATLNSGIFVTRPTSHYKTEFMYWILNSSVFNGFIAYNSTGTTIKHLYQNVFEEFQFPTPPILEQQKISAYLDHKTTRINTLIEKKKRLIELLKEERTAVINQAVTKGIDPNVPMKDSGIEWLGEIPVHWEIKRLKYITDVERGKFTHRPRNDPKLYGGDHPFIQTGDVSNADKFITSYSQTLNDKGLNVSKKFTKNTLVMTIAANIGDVGILDFNACFPDSVVGFNPKLFMTRDLLFYLLLVLKEEMLKTSIQNTQLNFNIERTQNLKISLPPKNEQNDIVCFIENETSRIDTIITKTKKEIDLLQEYRTALISEVVTGKIDVRDWKEGV
ncbi:restriction modification system DNA specificity domain-containing protein [Candidatus Magnetomorum sp. HK-1]|nr:restriction modification system DNA specificity domain-containing protein [Candidatus Magnetomorum sp. HK-1]